MKKEKMLKINEVSEYLQMNRMTIYKLARKVGLPGIKKGFNSGR